LLAPTGKPEPKKKLDPNTCRVGRPRKARILSANAEKGFDGIKERWPRLGEREGGKT